MTANNVVARGMQEAAEMMLDLLPIEELDQYALAVTPKRSAKS